MARSLAQKPDEVVVTEKIGEKGGVLGLTVASEDVNHLIGKQGRTVKAMRALLAVAATKKGQPRYGLEIITEGEADTVEATDPASVEKVT